MSRIKTEDPRDPLAKPCPDCGAGSGEGCVSPCLPGVERADYELCDRERWGDECPGCEADE
jgi:hypothetical protein